MRTGLRNALVLSLLVAAAALTWFFSRPAAERSAMNGEPGAALGYSMLDAVLTSTNADGLTAFEIRTALLTELPAEQRVVFEDLVVAQTLDDSAWRISADGATAPTDGSLLTLEGNTVLHLERTAGEPYVVRMPSLELERSNRIARARGPIELTVGNARLTAEALEVDLNARRLTLESGRGMRTSHITSAVAAAALSAAAAAQDAPEDTQEITTRWQRLQCAEECVIQGFSASGENWRLEAREASATRIEAASLDGEVRLTDVRFTVDDMSLAAPSAVFEFENNVIVEGTLSGDTLQLASGSARFAARQIGFAFEDGELATATLSGEPVVFDDLETRYNATAETIHYDYRKRAVQITGPLTFNRDGRIQLRCQNLDATVYYEIGTTNVGSGPCSFESTREGRDASAAARDSAARRGETRDSAAAGPGLDGTP